MQPSICLQSDIYLSRERVDMLHCCTLPANHWHWDVAEVLKATRINHVEVILFAIARRSHSFHGVVTLTHHQTCRHLTRHFTLTWLLLQGEVIHSPRPHFAASPSRKRAYDSTWRYAISMILGFNSLQSTASPRLLPRTLWLVTPRNVIRWLLDNRYQCTIVSWVISDPPGPCWQADRRLHDELDWIAL